MRNLRISNNLLDEILIARNEFRDNHGVGPYHDERLVGAAFLKFYPNKNFSNLDLRNANFVKCNLVNARFDYCNLGNADFTGSQLRYASFDNVTLDGTNFTDARMAGAFFNVRDISTCNFDNVVFCENTAKPGRREKITFAQFSNIKFYDRQHISKEFLEHIKSKNPTMKSKDVFIVHGRDGAMKDAVARFIERLGLNPIILNEQAGNGLTIIEKLERYSYVELAIVLLSPCDEGRLKNTEQLQNRARQNVILEFGYFMGKIGRTNTCTLLKDSVERPSDVLGIEYILFDNNDGWKGNLVRAIREAGFDVDANNIF